MSADDPYHPGSGRRGPLSSEDPFHYSRLDLPRGDLWLFTYGSLMWDPGFCFAEAAPALLRGYHRSFCIYSNRYRGTVTAPGLVLGLDRGGACNGMAYRIDAAEMTVALETLWQREMRRRVYVPRMLTVRIGARSYRALAFLANREDTGYAGRLNSGEIAQIIVRCCGERGPNIDYLVNTLQHLDELGVRDRHLQRLLAAVHTVQNEPRGRS